MEAGHVLVKNTFLQVEEDVGEDELPRAYSDQSHARKRVDFLVEPKQPIFAPIPEESTESLGSRTSSSGGALDFDELKSLRTMSRPEEKFVGGFVPTPTPYIYVPPQSPTAPVGEYKWQEESVSMGVLSPEGKSFTKTEFGGRLSLVTESEVRRDGVHRYMVQVESGPVSVADGFGFVFSDSLPCKKNIQKIDSIFISKRGKICSRVHSEMEILNGSGNNQLGSIDVGAIVELVIDLDALSASFGIYQPPRGLDPATMSILVRNEHSLSNWLVGRSASIPIDSLVKKAGHAGYFCAVLKNTETTVRFL
jgi:hypothetical protein